MLSHLPLVAAVALLGGCRLASSLSVTQDEAAAGHFDSTAGQSYFAEAADGQFQGTAGLSHVAQGAAGHFEGTAGQSHLGQGAAGHFDDTAGQSHLAQAAAGSYGETAGQSFSQVADGHPNMEREGSGHPKYQDCLKRFHNITSYLSVHEHYHMQDPLVRKNMAWHFWNATLKMLGRAADDFEEKFHDKVQELHQDGIVMDAHTACSFMLRHHDEL